MKKPKSLSKRKAAHKRAEKRTARRRKTEASKHIVNKQKKNEIVSQQKKFNQYMNSLLANPELQEPPQG